MSDIICSVSSWLGIDLNHCRQVVQGKKSDVPVGVRCDVNRKDIDAGKEVKDGGGYGELTLKWQLALNSGGWGIPLVADIDQDGKKEIIIKADSPSSSDEYSYLFVFDHKGNSLPNWPQKLSKDGLTYGVECVVGDITGDGNHEIICLSDFSTLFQSYPDRIHAFSKDGNELMGWPKPLKDDEGEICNVASLHLGDIDGDTIQEVIVNTYCLWKSYIKVLDKNAEQKLSLPLEGIKGNLAIGDINGDNKTDIVFVAGPWYEELFELHVVKFDGTEVSGFPVTNLYAGPQDLGVLFSIDPPIVTIGDFDLDKHPEIMVQEKGKISFFNNNGQVKNAWFLKGDCNHLGALGDINADGELELAFIDKCNDSIVGPVTVPKLTIYRYYDGKIIASLALADTTFESMRDRLPLPLIGNINYDPLGEIFVKGYKKTEEYIAEDCGPQDRSYDYRTFLNVYNIEGNLISEFPYGLTQNLYEASFNNPFRGKVHLCGNFTLPEGDEIFTITDLDGNGKSDVVTTLMCNYYGLGPCLLQVLEIPSSIYPIKIDWPMYGHDPQRTWNYETPIE